ncbi:hypothetical protein [Helicobacter canis]|uniref:hypothetical protein n=1 Tax=Helicobacter canis TaxID=29419 RepID=UPI0011C03781|nr:hypothetical protein [Helicobacter canis]
MDSRDSACGLESWIQRRRLTHYRLDKSLRLENKGHRSAQADVSLENKGHRSALCDCFFRKPQF